MEAIRMYQSETFYPDYQEGHTGITAVSFGVLRLPDGYWFDFDDSSFKNSGWTTRFQALTEEGNPDASGESSWIYTTGWAIPDVNSVYKVKYKVTDADGTFYVDGARIIVNDNAEFGGGAVEWTYTVTDADSGALIDGVYVRVTTDAGGANTIASGYTDSTGVVTFYLDAGTYYFWSSRSGYNFTNPDSETVA